MYIIKRVRDKSDVRSTYRYAVKIAMENCDDGLG